MPTKKALVRRVKKAIKKSRRRLDAEKFEKELTRTITFLENLQSKLKTNSPRALRPRPASRSKATTKKPVVVKARKK